MKNIQIIDDCLVRGEHTPAGTMLENVETGLAADLLASGRAVEALAKPEALNTRDPKAENRDPKPSKKGKDAPTE
jgi:hypothetical protein